MTYDYVCRSCSLRDEIVCRPQEITDRPPPVCSVCGVPMTRVFNAALAEWSREKGVFPYVDHNLDHNPITVQSQAHRRKLMKERGLYDRTISDDARHAAKQSRRIY